MSEEIDKLKAKIEKLRKRNSTLEQVINEAYAKLTSCNVDGAIEALAPYLPDSPGSI